MLVLRPCGPGRGNRPGLEVRRYRHAIPAGNRSEPRGRILELDQSIYRRHDLRWRWLGAHAVAGLDHRRDSAAIRHHVTSIRLRPSARTAFERRTARDQGKSSVGKSKAAGVWE